MKNHNNPSTIFNPRSFESASRVILQRKTPATASLQPSVANNAPESAEAIPLNQSVTENGGNHFPVAFWLLFPKKVTIQLVLT